jgi:hypothetical protein
MTHVTLMLSDELAQQARAAGLLTDEAMAQLLRQALRGDSGGAPTDLSAARMSEPALARIWGNPEDAIYDHV